MKFSSPGKDRKPIIGMVHLQPLPGSPLYGGSLQRIIDAAIEDAGVLNNCDIDGILIENFGDIPFFKDECDPHTISLMTRIGWQIGQITKKSIGINVLRNNVRAALSIALAIEAEFVRVNVHTGAMLTDQGIVEGRAAETLRYKRQIESQSAIMADVDVKHATPLGSFSLEEVAKDTAYRGLADALIVSGSGTGEPIKLEVVKRVRRAVPDRPLFAGSGICFQNIADYIEYIDGVIIGTAFKKEGLTTYPVDKDRVEQFATEFRRLEKLAADSNN